VVPFLDGFYKKFMYKCYKPCLKYAFHEIPLYLDYCFMRRRALNVLSYKAYVKIMHPLVGPFLGVFCAKFTNHVPTMLYVKYQSIYNASS